jgi:fructose-1,6-bisphosphatase/inositol monophosphatase family enzyme
MSADAVFKKLSEAVREAGALALKKQGTVKNDGKEAELLPGEGDHLRAMKAAKTVIDEQVQEILLNAVTDTLGTDDIVIDAEEDTPSLSLFTARDSSRSVVIDPIDGTLEYLEGRDTYSVCLALLEQTKVVAAIVFFPARDIAYALTPDGSSLEYQQFSAQGTGSAKAISLAHTASRLIYKTRRVPEDFEQRFVRAGFEVRGWDNYVQGLLAVLNGEACGYIAYEPQMRDILMGPILSMGSGGFMCDWQNNEIKWPIRGRLSQGFFGNASVEKEIRALLS